MIRRVLTIAITLLVFAAGASVAGPGDGDAVISPPGSIQASTSGTWTITYTTNDQFNGGTVRVTIPSGWTAPQKSSPASAGYTTVSSTAPTGLPPSMSIAGNVITISVDTLDTGLSLSVVYGDDSGSSAGRATAASALGAYEFTVADHPTSNPASDIANSPTIDITVGAPVQLAVLPADTSVTAGDFGEFSIVVEDNTGTPVPALSDRTVQLSPSSGSFYLPSNHSTPIAQVVILAGTQSARVDYRSTVADDHTLTVITTDGKSPFLAGITGVTVAPAAVSASQSTISATSPVVADGAAQSIVTVTSKDQYGNPRANDTVLIGADGDATPTQPGSNTNSSGVAGGVVTNTTAELVTVSATIGATPISATAQVNFIAGAADADSSTITASTPVVANGVSTSTITVTVRDAEGNPVPLASVSLSVSPSGDGEVLSQPGGVTGSNGVATGSLSSTKTGPRVIHAMADAAGLADSAVVDFVAGSVASFEWITDGASVAGVYEPVTLTARDSQGNVVTGYTGLVNLSTTSGGVGDGVVNWGSLGLGVLTNLSGDQATYQFALGDSGSVVLQVRNTLMETYRVNASAGASGQSSDIVNDHAAASQIDILAGDGQMRTVGQSVTTPPLVFVSDAFDNAVGGETVTFAPQTAGSSVDVVAGGGVQTTGTTNASGQLDCDEWTLATLAGPNTLRVSILAGSPFVDFTATGTPDVGASIVIAPASKSVTVNASEVVTLTLRDQYTNLVEGERVDVTITDTPDGTLSNNPSSPTNTINASTRWANTDANGQISVLYNAPGGADSTDFIDASTSNVPQSNVTDAVYTTTASGATNLRITFVGPSTVVAGATFQFTVEAVDGDNNVDTNDTSIVTLTPEPGSGLAFSESDFGTPVTQVTLSSGAATVYGQGTKARAIGWDITVDDAGPLGADTKKVTITDTGVVNHYFVSTVDSVVAGVSFNVAIEARDPFDNLVDTATNTVDLAAVLASDSTQLASSTLSVVQTTLVSGQANVGESYTKAESIQVRARDASTNEGFSGNVKVKAAAAERVFKVSGDASDVVAGADQPLVVEVRDAYGNPVPGFPSVAFVANGGGSMSPPSVPTGSDGRATSTLTTATTVGANVVRATILGGNPPDEYVDFVVQTVPGAIDHFLVTPAKTSAVAGEVFGVTATAKDANNNTVTTDNTTVVTMSSDGDMAFAAPSGSLTGGVFATSMNDTTAETVVVTATGAGKTGDSAPITVGNAPLHSIVYISGNASGLAVTSQQTLEVEARDQYGNTVAGAGVTFQILNSPGPASFIDAVGDPNDGITTTNGAGRGTVDLVTSTTAGTHDVKATILAGTPPDQRVDFSVSTVAGGITHYEVLLDASTQTAGVPVGVTVRALDGSNNLVSGDNSTSVTLSLDPGTGAVWGGANPATLSGGQIVTTVTLTQVQTFRVRARSTLSPSTTGLSAQAGITPDVPAGAASITGTPVPATITANGLTTSDITTSVITDQYGNTVAQGEEVVIATDLGTFDSVDKNPGTIENEQEVESDGRVRFRLRSEVLPSAQTATVTMNSVNGDAGGSTQVTFAQVPSFATDTPPEPDVVFVGDTEAFRVLVENTSTTGATLSPSTKFEFSDGSHTYSATLSSGTAIAAGDTATLVFAGAPIDIAQTPTYYAPTVTFVGSDQYGASFNKQSTLPAQSVLVSAVQTTSITAPPLVSRGVVDTVRVSINNPTPEVVEIDTVNPSFTPSGGNFVPLASPDLPRMIPPGNTRTIRVPIMIGAGTETKSYQIDAFVSGKINGKTVFDPSVAPLPTASWTVQAGATLAYVGGSLDPDMVSQGQVQSLKVRLSNSGQATVTLSAANTRVIFTDGDSTYTASLPGPVAIAGMMQSTLTFAPQRVPFMVDGAAYPVEIQLSGTENGIAFADTLTTASQGDLVTVESPAAIGESPAPSLAPTRVSHNQSVAFSVNLTNTGGASVVLDPASSLTFNSYSVALNTLTGNTLNPGSSNTITFQSKVIAPTIPTNVYFPTLHLVGTENGIPFDETFNLTTGVTVETAPDLAIIGIIPSQDTYTADQSKHIAVRMVVENNGGATVTFTDASIKFVLGGLDKTSDFTISAPTQFQGGTTLPGGGGVDTVMFDIGDAGLSNDMSRGLMTIEGDIEVLDTNSNQPVFSDPDVSSKGSLLVQSEAEVQLLSVIPQQNKVTVGMAKDFVVDLVVRNNGESVVDLDLGGANTFLSFSPSAGWNVTTGTLVGGGTQLAGGVTDTLRFNVLDSGSNAGTATIGATVNAIEVNSGEDRSKTAPSLGSVLVQTAGVLAVTDVQFSTPTLTNVSTVPWTITVDVTNNGESDLDVLLPAGVTFVWDNATTLPTSTVPSSLAGGGTVLSQGQSDQIVIPVMNTGLYPTLGLKQIDITVHATEVNSGVDRQASGSENVLIQEVPQLSYQGLMPDTVSIGASVLFQVDVRNFIADASTVTLDRTQTQLRFAGGAFAALLDDAGPDTIAESTTETLVFKSTTIPTVLVGPQSGVELELHWMENGRTDSDLISIPPADLVVQEAPELNIVSITPSRTTATQTTQPAWNIVMEINNGGDTAVDLDLSAAATKLTLNLLQGGANVTGQYSIGQPTGLVNTGGTILAGHDTDQLVFPVNTTGTSTGVVIVSGLVTGQNVLTSDIVSDNTFDGGSGSFTVQTPAELHVVSITPERTTVTVNQTSAYDVEMVVENLGGAAADLSLSQPSTDLSFTGSAGWATTLAPALKEGGTVIPGLSTRTVVFTVSTSGDTPGTTTIDGVVGGTESNTGASLTDDTGDGGSGQIDLETASDVVVTSVVASRASVTQKTPVAWNITVTLQNNGGSSVQLTLPTGVHVAIQDADGVTPMQYGAVNGLEQGGTVLSGGGATGTIVIPVTATGSFAPLGPNKSIDVGVDYVDLNSMDPGTASGAGSVTVQDPPNLVYVASSLMPSIASGGGVVQFRLDVQNSGTDRATAALDRGQTRFTFDGGNYSAFLDLASSDTIAAGETKTLVFEPKSLTSAAGPYDATLALFYNANGQSLSASRPVNGELSVQDPPALQILSIVASQSAVSAGMGKDWTATMSVTNNGPSGIAISLDPDSTYVTFNKAGVTGSLPGYTVVPPTGLEEGGTTLNMGDTGTLVFLVTQTGSDPGAITINGSVEGLDLGSGVERVSDDTFNGGAGSVTVQVAAALEIVRITPDRPAVTENQTTDWTARVVVKNTGEADARIYLDARSDLGFQAGAGWVTLPLGGGEKVIGGNATDSLLFVVDQTGDTDGTWRIDAGVRGFDGNSNEAVFDSTDTSGFGSITVQTPPAIRMTATSITAPNAPFVNTGQAFGVAVQVTNDGQATANNVAFTLAHTGNSTLGTPPVPVASVPAGSTRVYTFPVSAAGSPPGDTFTARFDGGVDANSGDDMTAGQFTRDDSTATAQIGAAAALAVTRVTPSQATVTRGQSTPWSIVVVVSNTGDAALNLTPPVAGNIAFSIGGTPSTGYTVVPPTTFYNGNAGWNLAGGATDSMTYTVTQTSGNDLGTVDIDATLGFADVNDPTHTGNDTGRGNVDVQNPAGLSIVSTAVLSGTFNDPSGSLSIVNIGMQYKIRVTVQNSGEAVDSVHVVLTSDGASAIALAGPDKISIAASGQGVFDFDVTAPGSPNPLETFTSSILYAQSHNTGLEVDPAQPTDNAHTTTTQTPADLRTTMAIVSPQGAKDGSVSINQQFTVGATVRNFGGASLTGTGQLTLALPSGFTLVSGSLTKAFGVAPTDTTFWTVQAPASPQGAENLTVSISTFPKDANNNQPAAASQPSASVAVSVEAGGAFSNTSLVFNSPAGALDGTISTDQFFRVLATVRPSADAVGVAATLLPPTNFTVVGASVKALGDGDGTTDKTATFDMIAPAGAVLDTVKVRFTATDRNTSQPLTLTLSLAVEVVPRTSLTLSASVIAPPEATDRTVTVGTAFTIRANVANAIGAAGITGTAQLRLTPPSGYALQSPAVQTFTIGANVDWVVEAAQIPSGPDDIVIDIVVPGPNDENTGQAATIASGQVTISMVTEGAAVSVLDVTSSLGIDTRVAPAGTADLRILGFDLRYDNSDTQAFPARIDTIAVTVVNKNGTPLSANAVQRTLSRVFIQLDAAAPYETAVISTNPVVVAFSGAGAERDIQPDSSRTVVVGLDLGKNPAEDEIRLQIRGNGVRVKDDVSNQPLGVVERSSRQPLDGRLTSQPLVILGSNFEEYAHNYPNPFRAGSQATHIAYFMNAPGDVSVKIYALTGDLVFEESIPRGDARAGAGPQEFDWDGRNMKGEVVRNGIYICVLNAGSNSAKIRIAVAK